MAPPPPRNINASTVTSPTNHTKQQINFLRGWPAYSLLPSDLLREASSRVLSNSSIFNPGLSYAADPGDLRLRKEVAKWLTEFYETGFEANQERICITGGASQSLGIILSTVTDCNYTTNIWMAAPAYFLAARIFQDAGFARKGCLRAVPEDEDGFDVKYLEERLKEADQHHSLSSTSQAQRSKPPELYPKIYRHVVYFVPSYSNPSSRTLSLRRRQELVRIARKYDVLIICDDVYDMLRWPTDPDKNYTTLPPPIPRLVDVDRTLDNGPIDDYGNVISNGSFSKICGPGMRTGWIEATEELSYLVSQAGSSKSGGCPSNFAAICLADLLSTGQLQRHVADVLRPAYAARYQAIRKAIEEYLVPLGASLPQSDREDSGGYFLWIKLPDGMTGQLVAEKALEVENCVVAQGERFEVPGDSSVSLPGHLRVCFSFEDTDKLVEGIQRLATVVKTLLSH